MKVVGRAMSTVGDRMLIIQCDAAQSPRSTVSSSTGKWNRSERSSTSSEMSKRRMQQSSAVKNAPSSPTKNSLQSRETTWDTPVQNSYQINP